MIRSNLMHPFHGALPVPYFPVRVTRRTDFKLVAHRYTTGPPRCRTSQHHMTYIPLSAYVWNVFGDPVFDGVGLVGFKSRANVLLLTSAGLSLFFFTVLSFSIFLLTVGIVGLWSSDWEDVNRSILILHCQHFLMIIISINNPWSKYILCSLQILAICFFFCKWFTWYYSNVTIPISRKTFLLRVSSISLVDSCHRCLGKLCYNIPTGISWTS